MSTAFPYVPLFGSSPYVYLFFAAVIGVAFGWFLERSGFGSAKMLTSVFTLRNFQVYKVMFTALLTAMIGSQVLSAVGLMDLGLLEVNTTYLLPMAVGGLLFGAGFYFGGFCPGTAVVSFMRGRLDGIYFLVGIVVGIYAFALFFDSAGQSSWFQSFYIPSGSSVMTALQSPYAWLWIGGITVLVMVSFRYLYIIEQGYSLRTPEELENGVKKRQVERPDAPKATRLVVGLALVLVVVLGVFQIKDGEPETVVMIGSEIPTVVAVDDASVPVVDPVSLAGWLIADANRAAEDKPPNAHVIDLRSAEERVAVPIRHALAVLPCETREDEFEATAETLNHVLTGADRNKPLVVVDDGLSRAGSDLVEDLRVQGINAMLLDGGAIAWQKEVLSDDAIWPEWIVDTSAASTSARLPSVDSYHDEVKIWMVDNLSIAPAYMPIPGTLQLPSEAATVVATGGGGGGCG
jgi:rhodanese-related sulfurtransferase